jgi:spore germination cell wall hydrolase CwlJ-like protein
MKKIIVSSLFFFLVFSAFGESDEKVIACTILGEARGEGKAGMYAVAALIQRRAIERKISPAKVCLQKYQFSCNNKGIQTNLLKTPQAEYALELANNINSLDTSFIKQANHYHTKSVSPYWSKGQKPVAVIGNHIFYKLCDSL